MTPARWIGLILALALCGAIGYRTGERKARDENRIADSPLDQAVAVEVVDPPAISHHGDPPASRPKLSAFMDQISSFNGYSAASAYFEGMTGVNVQSYLSEIRSLPPSFKRARLFEAFFRKWGEIDGEAAYRHAETFKGRERMRHLSNAAAGWAKNDPVAAYNRAILESGNVGTHHALLGGILAEIAKQDLRLAAQLAVGTKNQETMGFNSGPSVKVGMGFLIHQAEVESRFGELYPILLDESDSHDLGNNLRALFHSWAKYEYDDPLTLIESIGDETLSNQAMVGFLTGWAEADGEGAFRYAIANRESAAAKHTLSGLASAWVRESTGPEVASIIEEFAAIEDKSFLNFGVMSGLASYDPVASIDLAMDMEDQRSRERNLSVVMDRWAERDVRAAEAYATALENPSERSRAINEVIDAHFEQGTDPDHVIALTVDLENPKYAERALFGLVGRVANDRSPQSNRAEYIEALKTEVNAREGISDRNRTRMLEMLEAR